MNFDIGKFPPSLLQLQANFFPDARSYHCSRMSSCAKVFLVTSRFPHSEIFFPHYWIFEIRILAPFFSIIEYLPWILRIFGSRGPAKIGNRNILNSGEGWSCPEYSDWPDNLQELLWDENQPPMEFLSEDRRGLPEAFCWREEDWSHLGLWWLPATFIFSH